MNFLWTKLWSGDATANIFEIHYGKEPLLSNISKAKCLTLFKFSEAQPQSFKWPQTKRLQPKNIIPTKRKVLEKKVNPASWLSLDAGARGVQPNRTHIRWDNPVYMNGGTKREFKNAESLTGWCL